MLPPSEITSIEPTAPAIPEAASKTRKRRLKWYQLTCRTALAALTLLPPTFALALKKLGPPTADLQRTMTIDEAGEAASHNIVAKYAQLVDEGWRGRSGRAAFIYLVSVLKDVERKRPGDSPWSILEAHHCDPSRLAGIGVDLLVEFPDDRELQASVTAISLVRPVCAGE